MWRPAEALLYDWWPLHEERRWIEKMLATEVVVEKATSAVVAP